MYKLAVIAAAWSLVAIALPPVQGAKVRWLTPTQYDFGTIPRGKPVATRFDLINSGTAHLVIDNVRTPCGCTAVDWPELPLAPGDTTSITVEYNAGQAGYFAKTIKVFFHGMRGAERLEITGTVE